MIRLFKSVSRMAGADSCTPRFMSLMISEGIPHFMAKTSLGLDKEHQLSDSAFFDDGEHNIRRITVHPACEELKSSCGDSPTWTPQKNQHVIHKSEFFVFILPFSNDCSPFLNWDKEEPETVNKQAVIFQSLVATLKSQPAFDDSLEAKAVKFLESVDARDDESGDAFVSKFGQPNGESLTNCIESIGVLISSSNQIITTAASKMLESLFWSCSAEIRLALIKADLIPQIITTRHSLSISFAEAEIVHISLMSVIINSLWFATPGSLDYFRIEDHHEQQTVHETVLAKVLAPSEKYICHLCVNRFSIIDGNMTHEFMILLARLLEISPYHQPTMDFIVNMSVYITITSCLTFFEADESIWDYLSHMVDIQREWSNTRGTQRQMWKKVLRITKMEGIEDVIEERLQNDRNSTSGIYSELDSEDGVHTNAIGSDGKADEHQPHLETISHTKPK
ncbi:hypothetical protein BLNAU_6099 [Blattamonas nauphoetae]|uniref:Uncharacterized protein n=1 Tax=Blattamonas nauphoetae TaxID=2049346 RepID=A0ABQ9Y587_9EUKA|nr:hypothetical protein BLNAU_6099 [Blattamonas nauphoetae]